MKKNRICRSAAIVFLSLVLILSVLKLPEVYADGYTPVMFTGSGTVTDPYKISNVNELAALADSVNKDEGWATTNGKYYALTANIDLNDVSNPNWKSMAKEWKYGTADDIEQRSFKGHFNGNGFVIRGLYIKKSAKLYNGLFPGIMATADIENLGFEDCFIDASLVENSKVGAVAGGVHVWPVEGELHISTSYISPSVVLKGSISGGFIGHIVRKTVISNSYSNVNVIGSSKHGAFVGDVFKSISLEIKNCYSISDSVSTGALESNGDVSFFGSYSKTESKPGLARLTEDKFKGKNASVILDMLDFEEVWEARIDSYPRPLIFNKEKEIMPFWNGSDVSASLALEDPSKENSENNPYMISAGADLAYLGKLVFEDGESTKNKFYKITQDINLNDVSNSNWKSEPNIWKYGLCTADIEGSQAAVKAVSFFGNLDGNGKVIRGIYINDTLSSVTSAGLFPSIGGGAVVRNLGFEDSFVKVSRNVGAVAGITTGENNGETSIVISNCYVADTVSLSQTSNSPSYAGGFIGRINRSVSVDNCYSSATISKTAWQRIGGIIGGAWSVNYSVTFENCYNTQDIGYADSGLNFFIYEGNTTGSVTFNNCYTAGKTAGESGIATVAYTDMIGTSASISMPGLGYTDEDSFYTVNGKTPRLLVFGKTVSDSTSPVFSGSIIKNAASSEAIEISWQPAKDNITADEHIEYCVYISETEINAENLNEAKLLGTQLCETVYAASGLDFGKQYYFAVSAKDAGGNISFIYSQKAFATERSKNDVWSGRVAKMFEGGNGTEDNPYRIFNAEQLAYLVSLVNTKPADFTKDKYYVLENDIYLNDVSFSSWQKNNPNEWTLGASSGSVAKGFAGTFDGGYHTIHGLYIDKSGAVFNGLFSSLDGTAYLKNLGIVDCYISSDADTDGVSSGTMSGAIAGTVSRINFGGGETSAIIERCFVDETVYAYGTYCAGGIVGSVLHSGSNVKFIECYSGAKLESEQFTGSIIGDTWDPTYKVALERCYSTQSGVTLSGHTETIPTYTDCYANVSTGDGIAQVYDWQMRGNDAKKNMPAFDFENVWGTSENATPYILGFNNSSYGVDFPLIIISFDTNGGNSVNDISGYTGDKLTLPIPKREGYVFEGWYVYKELDIKYPLDTFPGYDLTLYAKWEDIAVKRQDFENYSYTVANFEGLGEDFELFRPGIDGYDPAFAHGGSKSIHRLGNLPSPSAFQLFDNNDKNKLEFDKNYRLRIWVYLKSTNNSSDYISIISTDSLDVYEASNGMLNTVKLLELKKNVWQEVVVDFVARGKFLSILCPGSSDVFFDDAILIPLESGSAGVMSLKSPLAKRNDDNYGSIDDQGYYSVDIDDITEPEVEDNYSEKTVKTTTTSVSPYYLWLWLSIGSASAAVLVLTGIGAFLIFIRKKRISAD